MTTARARAAALVTALATALTSVLALLGTAPAAASTLPPEQDAFYRYSGATPLSAVAPGTVLKSRSIQVSLGTLPTPVTAQQLLYRTTGQLGEPTVTVTTVLTPPTSTVAPRVVGYLSFYDGLAGRCDPSFTLAGGDAGPAMNQQAEQEELLIAHYLSMGWVVSVPDFEGTGLHWMAGRESGYGTLDALRATESHLHLATSTMIGLSGYSGGAVAGDWAAELAPAYAPELTIVGVALGGVPVDYAHLFDYVNGDQVNSSVMPGMLLGLARAYGLDLGSYLSAEGQALVRQDSGACITEVFSTHPGLTHQRLMKPELRNLFTVPAFIRIFNDQIMGSAPGHPRTPFLLAVGNSDGTGDTVMRADDVRALARQYCSEGVSVEYQEYSGADHISAGAFFDPQTAPYLQARFAGAPLPDSCGSIAAGGSLAPLPSPSQQPGESAAAAGSGTGRTGRVDGAGAAAHATPSLASTGRDELPSLVSAVAVGLAAMAGRWRRRA